MPSEEKNVHLFINDCLIKNVICGDNGFCDQGYRECMRKQGWYGVICEF